LVPSHSGWVETIDNALQCTLYDTLLPKLESSTCFCHDIAEKLLT
jgi:hypothetical protein